MRELYLICVGFMFGTSDCVVLAADSRPAVSMLVCAGGSEVFILDVEAAERGINTKIWSWTARVEHGVPEEHIKRFGNLDECKPLDGGKSILVCASNSGCGLIDRMTGKLIWSAGATNAHSLERLPRERIAVCSSLSGDKLLLFDMKSETPDKPCWSAALKSAHGVVWDEKRQVLWALGYDELKRYSLKDWETKTPSLEPQKSYRLPDANGHDLRSMPGSAELVITTGKTVQLFDRDTEKFRKHPTVGNLEHVKAIDVHPTTGRIAYSLWRQNFSLVGPNAEIATKGNTIYKLRWILEEAGK